MRVRDYLGWAQLLDLSTLQPSTAINELHCVVKQFCANIVQDSSSCTVSETFFLGYLCIQCLMRTLSWHQSYQKAVVLLLCGIALLEHGSPLSEILLALLF